MRHLRLYSAVFAVSLTCLAPQFAGAQSFLAPDPAAQNKAAAPAAPKTNDGYAGLIAPSAPAMPAPSSLAPPSPTSSSILAPATAPHSVPASPQAEAVSKAGSFSNKLKQAARRTRPEKTPGRPLPPELIAQFSARSLEKNGKTEVENTAAQQIQRAMKEVENPALTPEQKKQKAGEWYYRLLDDQDAMVLRSSSNMYKVMGLTKEAIEIRKQGNDNALDMTQKALRVLKELK